MDAGGGGGGTGMCDPSVLFDLDMFLMNDEDGVSSVMNSMDVPIKEEAEMDNEDIRYQHSTLGLPIPRRTFNGFFCKGESPAVSVGVTTPSIWSCSPAQRSIPVPFPATPFNTPSQNISALTAPDFRNVFLSSVAADENSSGSNQLANQANLSVNVKEEILDPEYETMKAVSMFPMEEDDIFQVDKADLIQGPTLAELNANDESLLSDLNFDDFILPTQMPFGGSRFRSTSSTMSDGIGSDRFRMAELNYAFATSPSLSNFELLQTRNVAAMTNCDDELSQLGSAQMGFELDQIQSMDASLPSSTISTASSALKKATVSNATAIGAPGGGARGISPFAGPQSGASSRNPSVGFSSMLSASLPANFGHVTLSKLTRRSEEGGRVKPPPPYPTSPPHKAAASSTLQELLSLKSPGRMPSPNPVASSAAAAAAAVSNAVSSGSSSSHLISSPAAQRPTHLATSARQRTFSNTATLASPSGAGAAVAASSAGTGAAGSLTPTPTFSSGQPAGTVKSPASLAATNPLLLARLSSSAPARSHLSNAIAASSDMWQRREPRNRLFSTSSLVEEVHGSASSVSTVGILSPGSFGFSHDEGFDSEEDSDHYEDLDDSDSDSGGSDDDGREPRPGSSSMSKKERFFWQYNVQAKGPKGQKISLTPETVDPHVLNEVQDPVFSQYCSVDGIKHSGKARRGDGNDLTPNPRKLHNIGRELDNLNRLINDMTPVSELPMAVRPKSRKEKNKLASRACRLKKKAQHEANKVKLYGLEQEHRKLMSGIAQVKCILANKYELMTSQQNHQEATNRVERISKQLTKVRIAGHSTDFVNRVLERVKGGEPSGGLDEI